MGGIARSSEVTTLFRHDPVSWVAAGFALVSVCTWASFATNGMWGDDWMLYAGALRGAGLDDTISYHFRPLARLQFAAFAHLPSASVFHLASLAIHLFVSWAVFLYLRSRESERVARIACLLFAGSFLANEAIYWISATGPLMCLLFILVAARAWRKRKPLVTSALLLAAAMSYELWIVGLVLLLFEGTRPWRHFVGPALVLALFVCVEMFLVGGGAVTSYGGSLGLQTVQRIALCGFRAVSPLSEPPGIFLSAVTIALIAALGGVRRYRPPVALYLTSVAILSLSSMMSSRFYYVPVFALVCRWCGSRPGR